MLTLAEATRRFGKLTTTRGGVTIYLEFTDKDGITWRPVADFWFNVVGYQNGS